MGALSERLADARREAELDTPEGGAMTWPHRAVAVALYAAVRNVAAEQVSVSVEWPGVGMYQAVVRFTLGALTVAAERGSIENSPYRAVVALNGRLIRQYQAQAPGK
jgi:hypothetical protein